MAKIKIVKTDSIPVCPHCKEKLHTIEKVSKGIFELTIVYICPYCKKVLSIGYSLGW